jgi:predicted aldo/keto reductase-like oxidoreductase
LKKEQRGDRCIECVHCEPLCPQKIPIRDGLRKANDLLGAKDGEKRELTGLRGGGPPK